MKTTRMILAFLAVIAVAPAQDVTTNYDQNTDFSKYKTYKWIEIPGGVKVDDILARQLAEAVDAQLAAKGLGKTDNDNVDLYVGYQVATSQERELNAYSLGYALGRGRFATATTSTLTIGSFSWTCNDEGMASIWWWRSTKTIDPKASAEKRQKNIQNGAAKLLKNFPPKKNKRSNT